MSNLMASLNAATKSLKAYEQALAVVQNNVTNATTPGYVRQQADLVSLAFQPNKELAGGVEARSFISSRDQFSERAVWQQAARYGRISQTAAGLAQIEPVFDITEGAGIAGAIDSLYGAFSQWSVTPNDLPTRQAVLSSAESVSRAFQFTANSIAQVRDYAKREAGSVAAEINAIAQDISELNIQYRQDFRNREDAGLDAQMHAALEQLAELADFNTIPQEGGGLMVLLGGQTPLVIGDKAFAVSADTSGAQVEIRNYKGEVITSQVAQGRLKGLLDLANTLLPSYLVDLDHLAVTFADRINEILEGGVDQNGQPPIVGLFTYDAAGGAARTLAVTDITAEELAGALSGELGGNGNALALAALAISPELGGFTFTEYYGQIASKVGGAIAAYTVDRQSQSLLLSQARSLRDQESAVDLNEEAAQLLEYQRSYQAVAKMIEVLDELTEVVIGLLR